MLSIIVPALAAEATIECTMETCVQAPPPRDIIVVDGESCDDTRAIALSYGARVVSSHAGRGTQLAMGAEKATGDWLLFLHADTRLADGWQSIVEAFIRDPVNLWRAGVFRLHLDDPSKGARRIECLANWRSRALGLPYGDQGLLISRKFYDELHGFQTLPIMEDVDFMRRVGRQRVVMLDADAITSPTRYQRDGYWVRPIRNLVLLCLYYLGVPPRLLSKAYD